MTEQKRRYTVENALSLLYTGIEHIQHRYALQYIGLNPNTDSSQIQQIKSAFPIIHWKPKDLRHNCFIGVKCLYENQTEGYVRDQDLAFCVKHLMHETRHLYQNQVLYQEPLIGFSLDMAKMDALSSYFSGYRQNMYEVLPSELDAEIHGLLDTVAFFDQIIDENGEKILDAKTCLENCYFERRNFRIYSPYDEKIVP